MATTFSTLAIIDLQGLKTGEAFDANTLHTTRLSEQIYDAFATTGFAYLINAPLSFSHQDIFTMTKEFFSLPDQVKMNLAKKTFQPTNANTYRGYFPTQPLSAADNLKEGFEMGPKMKSTSSSVSLSTSQAKFKLDEANVWPDNTTFKYRLDLEQFYNELQSLSSTLLSLIAISLGKPEDFFAHYLTDSISTLRLLHYPPTSAADLVDNRSSTSLDSTDTYGSYDSTSGSNAQVRLACTPHTDSGILTLLHQDSTGGLEVRNAAKAWIPAPYIPGSIVVNIGDLMAEVSGGRFIATLHRVRAPSFSSIPSTSTTTWPATSESELTLLENRQAHPEHEHARISKLGRFSVPFFFEPGESCVVTSIDNDGSEHGILYGDHVRLKMKGWVEFQDDNEDDEA